MTLGDLLNGVTVIKMFHTVFGQMAVTQETHISTINYNSRLVSRGDLFVALRGSTVDGHKFLGEAVHNGAAAVVVEDDESLPDPMCMHTGTAKIVVENSRKALAIMAANYFRHSVEKLNIIGVTGTNGKTTTTYLLKHIIENCLKEKLASVGLVGTIANIISGKATPAINTTPESLELHGLFDQMVKDGCSHAVMEVSSHALHQFRVFNVPFSAGIFTNLTQDHLDYHQTMAEYFLAKKTLFDQLPVSSFAVVNSDDAYAGKIVADTNAAVISFGFGTDAAVRAENISLSTEGTKFDLRYNGSTYEVDSPYAGRFNISNTMAAAAAAIISGCAPDAVCGAVRFAPAVPGRFERLTSSEGWSAIIDYAHTPDALEKCLRTIKELLPDGTGSRIISVFGAGGDRDAAKRPVMGKIVEELSDVAIITSDNPRSENPERIIDAIASGMERRKDAKIEPDRRAAIALAVSLARKGDVILIAGKGHEEYQVIGKEKKYFSDKETIRPFLH